MRLQFYNWVILKNASNEESAYLLINFMLGIDPGITLLTEKFAGPALKEIKSKLPNC